MTAKQAFFAPFMENLRFFQKNCEILLQKEKKRDIILTV